MLKSDRDFWLFIQRCHPERKSSKGRKRLKKKCGERGEGNTAEERDKNDALLYITVNKSYEKMKMKCLQPHKSYCN